MDGFSNAKSETGLRRFISSDTVRDIGSGTVAGVISKFVDFPFDTVKVTFQAPNSPYKSYLHASSTIFKNEGIAGFYRGVGAPVAGAGLENAVCFSFFGFAQRHYRWSLSYGPDEKLPFAATLYAGAVSGFAVAHVLTPVELLKCRMQVQNLQPVEQREYRNVVDCAVKTVRKDGLKGLYAGHTATLARETPGNAAWFGFYNLAQRAMLQPGQTTDDLPGYKKALAGGCGGVMYWTTFFPADVVKTKMQVDPAFQTMGLAKGLSSVLRTGGVRALYSGWGITVVRAFPANAAIFFTYETCAKYFDTHFGW